MSLHDLDSRFPWTVIRTKSAPASAHFITCAHEKSSNIFSPRSREPYFCRNPQSRQTLTPELLGNVGVKCMPRINRLSALFLPPPTFVHELAQIFLFPVISLGVSLSNFMRKRLAKHNLEAIPARASCLFIGLAEARHRGRRGVERAPFSPRNISRSDTTLCPAPSPPRG